MMLKLKWFVFVLLVSPSNLFAQFYESIEKDAVNYFLSLVDNNSISESNLKNL